MKIELKEAADKLIAANNIVVTAHVNPDGDAIGSSLALAQILHALNKNVRVFIDDKIPRNFSTMPYIDKVERPDGTNNVEADLLVILDASPDRVGRVVQMTKAPILNIDHHVTNDGEGVDLYLESEAAATCEIIFKLQNILGVAQNSDIAQCLYTGIATDTGFFIYANTRPATMRAAADLIEAGVKPNLIAEQMERKSLGEVQGMIEALKTTKLFFNGKVVGLFIDEKLSHQVDSTEGFIDLVRIIDDVEVAFLLTYKAENFCRVSMRSRNVDVSAIAAKLGGGGHIRAAGCSIKAPFDVAKLIIINAIGEAITKAS